jgi:hypothetical protein
MESFSVPFLIASAPSILVTIICTVIAGMAFIRQTELGTAAVVAGCGFGSLAAASALQASMLYVNLSATAHHIPVMEMARVISLVAFGERIFQIAGVILLAIAMFQERPRERSAGAG